MRQPVEGMPRPQSRKRGTVSTALRAGVTVIKFALVFGVVGFKVLEWWFLVAEKRLEERLPQAVPPPPPAP